MDCCASTLRLCAMLLCRHILVNDTAGPVRFYHFNPEHSVANANSEFRGSHNISVFGTKSEGHSATLWVRDCTNVFHSGHAGAYNALFGATFTSKRSLYQDRLATKIRKLREQVFSAGNANPLPCDPETCPTWRPSPCACDWTTGLPSLFRVENCRGNCRFGNVWSQTTVPSTAVLLAAGEEAATVATAAWERPAVVAVSDTLRCVRNGPTLECEHMTAA
jgi:hypothetical protein